MKFIRYSLLVITLLSTTLVNAAGWVEGIPNRIQKTDYSGMHLLFIQMEAPVSYPGTQCDNNHAIVIQDSNESSEAAMSMAMTALVAKLKFKCYINTNQCSRVNGSLTTFPVCEYYPTLSR